MSFLINEGVIKNPKYAILLKRVVPENWRQDYEELKKQSVASKSNISF